MLCAHTVRRLKPGTFDQFAATFVPPEGEAAPSGWVRFHTLRSLADENEVVTFGFFDGTLEELERSQADAGFEELRDSIGLYVESVVSNGVYEIVVSRSADDVPA
jgi:hypothetical protein